MPVSAAWSRRILTTLLALMFLAGICAGCGDGSAAGRDLENQGDLAGAVDVYRSLLREDPEDLEVLRALAFDLLLLNRHDEALEIQEKIVALDPEDSLTRVELGFNYLNHQDQPALAVEYLKQATMLEPSAKYLTFLAQAQIQSGDPQAALESLTEAIARDRTYPHAYVVLVDLLEDQGRAGEAEECRRSAREAGVTLGE